MSVVVQTVKVCPRADVADVSGCRDGVATPWCWYGRCKWQLYRWSMYTLVVMVLMSVVIQIVKVHLGVGDADVSRGIDGVGTP